MAVCAEHAADAREMVDWDDIATFGRDSSTLFAGNLWTLGMATPTRRLPDVTTRCDNQQ